MKSISVCLLFLCFSIIGFSQTLDRTVIGSSGGFSSNSSAQLEYTVGEVAVSSIKKSSVMLTEGFNQGFVAKKDTQGSVSPSFVTLSVKVYPNPATDYLTIENNENTEIQLEVFDYVGKQVNNLQKVSGNSTTKLTIDHLPNGIYMIKMLDENKNLFTYRWIKQ